MGSSASTPLHEACSRADVPELETLLYRLQGSPETERLAAVNALDNSGTSALEIACDSKEMDRGTLKRRRAVELLLEARADLNHSDSRGWTALHRACSVGDGDVAELLLARGADPTIRDTLGLSPRDVLSVPFRGLGVEADVGTRPHIVGAPPAAVRLDFEDIFSRFVSPDPISVWLSRAIPGVSDDELEVHWQRGVECDVPWGISLFQCTGPKPWDLTPCLSAFCLVSDEGAKIEGKAVFRPDQLATGTYRAMLVSEADVLLAASAPFAIEPNSARTML